MLVSSPVHLRALLASGLRLPPIERILSATAPMSPQFANELESQFETEVLEVFGCTESGILASRFVGHEKLWTLADIFCLTIVEGQARITADHLPETVYLQDVVEKQQGQRFRWLGRHEDQVNIAGKRGSLADINRRLLEVAGVLDGVVFFPNDSSQRLAALVVAPTLTPRQVVNALRTKLDPVFLPRPLLMVKSLPRTDRGKLPKDAVIELFAKTRSAKRQKPSCA
jgi:acyl-coenzyme A synthetase/AMP-(fatty) acid ligase